MVEAVTTTRRRASSDGTSSLGPLVLRICSPHREGQIVRLKSPKCTIGSGEHCTLRIRAQGVQPLHCILIRKAAKTVVRRWAKDTRLNGEAFTDALLNRGDRLSIGPIEFEVLESGPGAIADLSRDGHSSDKVSGGVGKRDSLVEHLQTAKDLARKRNEKMLQRLRDANRRIEELTNELSEYDTIGEVSPARGAAAAECERDRESLRAEQARLSEEQAELRRTQAELESREKLVAEQAASLEGERQCWQDEQNRAEEARQRSLKDVEEARQEQEDDLAGRLETVVQQEQAIADARSELENTRSEWEAERQSRDLEEKGRVADLENRAAELDAERIRLDRIREDLAAREEELVRDGVGECVALQEGAEDIEAIRADLEQQRVELARAREELDSLREAIGTEREAVEAERERCESLAEKIEARRVEAEGQLGVAAQEAAELRAERQAFAEEQEKWEAAQLDAQKQIEQRAEQLDRQKEVLDLQKEELANDQANWEGLKAEAEAQLATRAEQLDTREHELDERIAEYERSPAPAASGFDFFGEGQEAETPAKSTNSLDLFRQMEGDVSSQTRPLSDFPELRSMICDNECEAEGLEPDVSDSEPPIVMQEASEGPQRSVSEILLEDPVIADSFVPRPSDEAEGLSCPAIQPHGDDEEESIEQYMAGLLARVNGGSTAAPAQFARQKPAAKAAPDSGRACGNGGAEAGGKGLPEAPSPGTQPRPVTSESAQVAESRPRARAPEKAEDLVTLRELANLSAQSALDTHARSRLIRSVNAKLAVVAVALATAGVLFWRWFAIPNSVMHYYMGLAVILIAVLWGVQYAALAGYAYLTHGGRRAPAGESSSVSKQDAPQPVPVVAEDVDETSAAEVPPSEPI